jgi:hypothetical protein
MSATWLDWIIEPPTMISDGDSAISRSFIPSNNDQWRSDLSIDEIARERRISSNGNSLLRAGLAGRGGNVPSPRRVSGRYRKSKIIDRLSR